MSDRLSSLQSCLYTGTVRHRRFSPEHEFQYRLFLVYLDLTELDTVFAGRWLTPPLAPMRFDNRFFLLEWPAERAVQPSLMGGEHVLGEWILRNRKSRGDHQVLRGSLHAGDRSEAGRLSWRRKGRVIPALHL